jgi:hypothetical protein
LQRPQLRGARTFLSWPRTLCFLFWPMLVDGSTPTAVPPTMTCGLPEISKKAPARRRCLFWRATVLSPQTAASIHHLLQSSTYVVSYNKLRRRANATKIGSNLPAISKKAPARRRCLFWQATVLSPQTAASIHHLSQSSTYVLSL